MTEAVTIWEKIQHHNNSYFLHFQNKVVFLGLNNYYITEQAFYNIVAAIRKPKDVV